MTSREEKLLSEQDLDIFKDAMAKRIGIESQIKNDYWGNITSRDCGKVGGKIGGNMVKIMIREVEKQLSEGKQL